MKKLNPKCITENRDLAYTSTGHLTPCCWTNGSFKDPYLKEILSDEMHIDNFKTIEDILTSKPWIDFFSMLKDHPEKAPFTCKYYCSSGKSWEEIEGSEIRIISND